MKSFCPFIFSSKLKKYILVQLRDMIPKNFLKTEGLRNAKKNETNAK